MWHATVFLKTKREFCWLELLLAMLDVLLVGHDFLRHFLSIFVMVLGMESWATGSKTPWETQRMNHGSHGFPLDFPRFWGFLAMGFWGFPTVSQHQKSHGFAALAEIFSDFSDQCPMIFHLRGQPISGLEGTQREEIYQHGAPSLYEGRGVVDWWIGGLLVDGAGLLGCNFQQVAAKCPVEVSEDLW